MKCGIHYNLPPGHPNACKQKMPPIPGTRAKKRYVIGMGGFSILCRVYCKVTLRLLNVKKKID
jgi:hypothetical protein